MIDLSKESFYFRKTSPADVAADLRALLPSGVRTKVKGGRVPQIRVRQGFWRGAILAVQPDSGRLKLAQLTVHTPGLFPKLALLVISIFALTALMAVIVSMVIGEFIVPGVFGIGGIAGVAMYSFIETMMLKSVRSNWLVPALYPAIEKLKG
jgi:hypothetical protein